MTKYTSEQGTSNKPYWILDVVIKRGVIRSAVGKLPCVTAYFDGHL